MLVLQGYRRACFYNGLLTLLYFASTLGFYLSQGFLFSAAITGDVAMQTLWALIAVVAVAKVVMLLCTVGQANLPAWVSAKECQQQFICYFPERLYRRQAQRSAPFFNMINYNIEQLFKDKLLYFQNQLTFFVVCILYLGFLLYSHFNLNGVLISLLFALAYANQLLQRNRTETFVKYHEQSKLKLLQWLDSVFRGAKEWQLVWPQAFKDKRWLHEQLAPYTQSKLRLLKHLFKVNCGSQVLVEIPFVAITSYFIVQVYLKTISLPVAFAWFGVSQFILLAAQGLGKNAELGKKAKAQAQVIEEFLHDFTAVPTPADQPLASQLVAPYQFSLQDGLLLTLGTEPGLYRLQANNGVGKTTLLDSLLSYENCSDLESGASLQAFRQAIPQAQIRLIDRNAQVVPGQHDFVRQVVAPFTQMTQHECLKQIHTNLRAYCRPTLSDAWIDVLKELATTLAQRTDLTLSAGETVLLSLARCWFSWTPEVKVLLLDEVDAPLDKRNRNLFYQMVQEVRLKVAIYMVSHSLAHHGLGAEVMEVT